MTGEQVKHYRAVMGLSQNQLAVLLGVDPATTWRWDKVGISEHKVLMCLYYFAQHGPITLADVERVDGWMYSELQMEGVP
jgi:transcriptional regulator with XRE-family HTH domain